ncbi:MAG: 16S rRNA (guanine(527)-N(7))-methyltransferase RsmG [Acidobacteria bacterium]|nr:16S rRNA (guanine(527)-N(7))-methyltransferase RsmG [Acidobacteriota bacterium]
MSEEKIRQFGNLLKEKGRSIGIPFTDDEQDRLTRYYRSVLQWNDRLHLTTLTEPFQFFHRHIFESDFAETFIVSSVEEVWDLGSGLGVPGMLLAILRPDLKINLVESKRVKVIFLEDVISTLNLRNVKVIGSRIEEIASFPSNSCLIARAVERMEKMVRQIVILGENCRQIVFLGSRDLGDAVKSMAEPGFSLQLIPIPGSESRFVLSLVRST